MNTRTDHKTLVKQTVTYLEESGHTDIKAVIDGYEDPKSFSMRGSDVELTPDIVTNSPEGNRFYVEVPVRTADKELLKSKWLLLDKLAEIKKSGFRVISWSGHYTFADRILSSLDMSRTATRM